MKSILNLQARQRLRTENEKSRPSEFDLDQCRTELSVTLDTPLNRRAQRNRFREQLIDYQAGRRAVMGLEDTIKLAVRNDLRALRLAEEQYSLNVASAALAYERSISTALQLRLGVANVAARDFLEAQTAYTVSLSAVAGRHIDHILSRIGLFVELEQLVLADDGEWPLLYDESQQPEPLGEDPSLQTDPYGYLPPVFYSKHLRDRFMQFWTGDSE